jgi:hypothetical protein
MLRHAHVMKTKLASLWRKIGGGSLLLSICVHAAILIGMTLILMKSELFRQQVDFLPAGRTEAGMKADSDLQQQKNDRRRNSLKQKTPKTRIVIAAPRVVHLPAQEPVVIGASDGFGGAAGTGTMSIGSTHGLEGFRGSAAPTWVAGMPSLFQNRCSTQARLEKLRQNGGTPECEAAVSHSLEWLKTQQNPDGSWGRTNKAAMTGLALLCYLGRCETPDSPFYGDHVRSGMLWLVELAGKNPHGMLSEQITANSAAYEHGIATYALGEMYSFCRLGGSSLPGLRATFEKGVQLILAHQNERGAWTYGGKQHAYDAQSRGEDLSVTGWQFQALKAAKHSGLKITGLDRAIDRCCDYLLSMQTKDGGFGKTNRDEHYNQWSLTGCGLLGLQTLAKGKTTAVKKGLGFLRDFLTAEPLDWDRNCNLYCWYYQTQAFFQAGGDDWRFYNAQFLPQILQAQQPDGSFRRGRPNWPAGDAAAAIYRQCLCTLQLEVFYRYLKVGDRGEESVFER